MKMMKIASLNWIWVQILHTTVNPGRIAHSLGKTKRGHYKAPMIVKNR